LLFARSWIQVNLYYVLNSFALGKKICKKTKKNRSIKIWILFTRAITMFTAFTGVLRLYHIVQERLLHERTPKWRNKYYISILLSAQNFPGLWVVCDERWQRSLISLCVPIYRPKYCRVDYSSSARRLSNERREPCIHTSQSKLTFKTQNKNILKKFEFGKHGWCAYLINDVCWRCL